MPDILYELSSGVSQNALLNLKTDTNERMSALLDYQIPKIAPVFIPKEFTTDDILNNKEVALPTLEDALISKDPAIQKAAIAEVRRKAQSTPEVQGYGLYNMKQYTEGQDRYTNKAWYKEDIYTKGGYDASKSLAQNEAYVHDNVWDSFSGLGKTWRGVGTFSGHVLSKLVTGLVGTVGDLGAMAWYGIKELATNGESNFWDGVSNNVISRGMEELDQHVKDEWLPTYKSLDYDNKGAWGKLLDANTWTGSFADGVGFLLQFAVPGAAFGKLAMAGKFARTIGKLEKAVVAVEEVGDVVKLAKAVATLERAKNISGFTYAMGAEISNTSKLGRFAGHASELLTGSKNVGGISAHLYATSMEAVQETKMGFDENVRSLMDGGMSREDAVKTAGESAPGQFLTNLGILAVSTAFENKLLQKAIGNRGLSRAGKMGDDLNFIQHTPSTKLGMFFENNKWGNRLKFYGGLGFKTTTMEAFWEENLQTVAQRIASKSYIRRGDDTGKEGVTEQASGFWNQAIKQTKDALKGNDREAADAIMAGAVIGLIGGGVMTKLAGQRKDGESLIAYLGRSGERKNRIAEKALLVSKFKNGRDALLSINTFAKDIYKEDGTIDEELAKTKVKDIQEKLDAMDSVFKRTVSIESLTDPLQRRAIEEGVFSDYVKAHILNDTHEQLIDRLQNWDKTDQGVLSLYGVSPEMKKDALEWAGIAEALVDKYDEIKDTVYDAPADMTIADYTERRQAIHSTVFDYTSRALASKRLAEKYRELKDLKNPFSKFGEYANYNENVVEIEVLKNLLKSEFASELDRKGISEKIEELEKKQEEMKKSFSSLGDTKTDSIGLIFPKDANIAKESKIIQDNFREYFNNKDNQTQYEIAEKSYTKLAEDYLKPDAFKTYEDAVDFWEKQFNKEEEGKDDLDEEVKKTIEEHKAEIEQLKTQLAEATTKEQREELQKQIDEIEKTLKELEEVVDIPDDEDQPPVPTETQYGTDDYVEQGLAIETPFKTSNKETKDVFVDGVKVPHHEYVSTDSYAHKLTEFVMQFNNDMALDDTKYQVFVIKDSVELMKQRLTKKQLEAFDEKQFEVGVIVVFKEKGKSEFKTMKVGGKEVVIAFSFNEGTKEGSEIIKGFDLNIDVRAEAKARRDKTIIPLVLEFYKQQQKILDDTRKSVITTGVPIEIKAQTGSFGVTPVTFGKFDNALTRFDGYYDVENPFTNVISGEEVPNGSKGQTYLKIPAEKTHNGKEHFIHVQMAKLSNKEGVTQEIYNSVQIIQSQVFPTWREAKVVITDELNKLFYVNDDQKFVVVKVKDGYRIGYEKKGVAPTYVYSSLKLKMLDDVYKDNKKLIIYNRNRETGAMVSKEITNDEYVQFIKDNATTATKLLTIKKGDKYKIYTEQVNAYLNLAPITDSNIESTNSAQTTEEQVKATLVSSSYADKVKELEDKKNEEIAEEKLLVYFTEEEIQAQNDEIKRIEDKYTKLINETVDDAKEKSNTPLEDKKADIERRRQEELLKVNTEKYKILLNEIKEIKNGDPNLQTESKVRKLGDKLLKDNNILNNVDPKADSWTILSVGKNLNQVEDNLEYLIKNYKTDKINAKYDAELEKQPAPEKRVDIVSDIKNENLGDLKTTDKKTGVIRDIIKSLSEGTIIKISDSSSQRSNNNDFFKTTTDYFRVENEGLRSIGSNSRGEFYDLKDIKSFAHKGIVEILEQPPQTKNVVSPSSPKKPSKDTPKTEKELALEELRKSLEFTQETENVNPQVEIYTENDQYIIDFSKNEILGDVEGITKEDFNNIIDQLEKSLTIEVTKSKINQKDLYYLYNNRMRTFVVVDDSFNIISKNEVKNDEEFKRLENCK